MAMTKINFYLSAIFLVILIFFNMGEVGTEFSNSDRINLDSDSIDYVLEVKGVNSQSGFDNISNTNSADSQQSNLLDSSDDSQVSDTNDFLSTLYIKKERASAPTNFFKLVYNIPTSMIKGLGFNITDWTHTINIVSYVLFISLIILIWTRLINT